MDDIFPTYSFRLMEESDLDWVLKARNADSVRAVSGSNQRITKRAHYIWFDCSTDSLKLVFLEDEKPKGVLIYDAKGFWSFYLIPAASRHSGLGRLMLSIFLVYAKRKGIKEIKAHVMPENVNSKRLHFSLGFHFDAFANVYIKEL